MLWPTGVVVPLNIYILMFLETVASPPTRPKVFINALPIEVRLYDELFQTPENLAEEKFVVAFNCQKSLRSFRTRNSLPSLQESTKSNCTSLFFFHSEDSWAHRPTHKMKITPLRLSATTYAVHARLLCIIIRVLQIKIHYRLQKNKHIQ